MLNFKIRKAFTLVELLVATIISSVVLIAIFAITSEILDEAVFTNKSVSSYSNLYDIEKELIDYKNIYSTGTVIIDNPESVWSDVFMFLNTDNSEALLMWIVNNYSSLLVPNSWYSVYWNNSLWFREVTGTWIIDQILKTPLIVYSTGPIFYATGTILYWTGFKFQRDKIYEDFVLKDMQMISYNTWTVREVTFDVNLFFNENLEWEDWNILPKERVIDFTINF